jgi:hypothetical protein
VLRKNKTCQLASWELQRKGKGHIQWSHYIFLVSACNQQHMNLIFLVPWDFEVFCSTLFLIVLYQCLVKSLKQVGFQ